MSGRDTLHALGCSMQTLGNSHYTWQHIHTSICYFLLRWRVFVIYPCASCFGVAAYLILVFLSSLVGNLKPPNGIFQSPLPNCSDTLMVNGYSLESLFSVSVVQNSFSCGKALEVAEIIHIGTLALVLGDVPFKISVLSWFCRWLLLLVFFAVFPPAHVVSRVQSTVPQ